MRHPTPTQKRGRQHGGFTMFFAVLVSTLALAIGLAIYDLVARELHLSSTAEQSQYAIYAADTGAECALYWDFHYTGDKSIFATSTEDYAALGATGAICSGTDITNPANGWQVSVTPTMGTTSATLQIGKYSAIVSVVKTFNATTGSVNTKIYSRGFNTASPSLPNTVERELQVSY